MLDSFDIRDHGALDTPDDIGPAVQRAANKAIAAKGGVVYIPPRSDARMWGWVTGVSAQCSTPAGVQDFSLSFVGLPGQTAIKVASGQPTPLYFGNSNAICEVDGLIFAGDPTAGPNSPCVIDFQQARIGRLRRSQFWGLDCNASGYGLVRLVADTTHIEDVLVVGCNYSGALHQGGCLSVTGHRDSCLIEGVRFVSGPDGSFAGTAYNKSNSAQNVHLWLGSQGLDGAVTAYGEVCVRGCYFESSAVHAIDIAPESTFVLDHARVLGCTFNQNNGTPAINSRQCNQLIVDGSMFGNAAAGQPSIGFQGQRLIVRNSKAITGGKTIVFTGPTTYVEVDESDGFSLDTSIAAPISSFVKSNGVITHPF